MPADGAVFWSTKRFDRVTGEAFDGEVEIIAIAILGAFFPGGGGLSCCPLSIALAHQFGPLVQLC